MDTCSLLPRPRSDRPNACITATSTSTTTNGFARRTTPTVVAHLHEENAYTKAKTEHLAILQEQLFEEIRARTKETDLSVPSREGEWWYYTRTVEGEQYGIHCRAPIAGPDDWEPPAILAR